MPSLSAFADPFVPRSDHFSIKYFLDQFDCLKSLEPKVLHDPVLLSRIKSASYQLMQQFNLLSTGSINTPISDINVKSSIQPINYSTTDRTNSSVSTSSTSTSISTPADFCLSPLTPRQQKRQLRASTFKARKTTASPETSISRDSKRPLPPKPADPRYNNFFKYLDVVDQELLSFQIIVLFHALMFPQILFLFQIHLMFAIFYLLCLLHQFHLIVLQGQRIQQLFQN